MVLTNDRETHEEARSWPGWLVWCRAPILLTGGTERLLDAPAAISWPALLGGALILIGLVDIAYETNRRWNRRRHNS